jgi:hypothetical protein
MFFPFCPFMMLGIESGNVIALRLLKLAFGGAEALNEINLMMSEKLNAALETSDELMAGASGDDVIHQYRRHVAANAKRLTTQSVAGF